MSKLLARAKAKKFSADNSYNFMSLDDAYIDECCFNLQQAIEFCLKYLVEMCGERYIENHDIRAQINKLKSLNKEFPCEEKLRMMASTINEWAVETRYNDNFVALLDDIEDARKIAEELVTYCDKLVKTEM
jgi:HEPN domain-containing protein